MIAESKYQNGQENFSEGHIKNSTPELGEDN